MLDSTYILENGLWTPIATALNGMHVEPEGFEQAVELAIRAKERSDIPVRVFFVGNGGSAAISSHMSADWMKNGKIAAMSFNDGASLTCIANDIGYERAFQIPLRNHGRMGDILFAISSSGRSLSILNAVWQAKNQGLIVITLSGFDPDNPLRKEDKINFYIPSRNYGVVEIAHLTICHAILDRVVSNGSR